MIAGTTLNIRRLALAVNPSKEGAEPLAKTIEKMARERGVETFRVEAFPVPQEGLKGIDLCCVLGGDGSILGVVNAATFGNVPVLGINFGALGFMANFAADEAIGVLRGILSGDPCQIDRRSVLECRSADGKCVLALNDLVIKTPTSRLIQLRVRSGKHDVNDYYADGLIVATPTGSTAYNVSAGGPIIHPSAAAIVLTPINPHTLSNRAIVLNECAQLAIELCAGSPEAHLSADGRAAFAPGSAFPITVTICQDVRFPLVQHDDYSHFHVLRRKLKWSGQAPFRLSK